MGKEFWVKCCSDSKPRAEVKMEGKKPSSGFVISLFSIQSIKLKADSLINCSFARFLFCALIMWNSMETKYKLFDVFKFQQKTCYPRKENKTQQLMYLFKFHRICIHLVTVKTITFKLVKKYEHGLYRARCITSKIQLKI